MLKVLVNDEWRAQLTDFDCAQRIDGGDVLSLFNKSASSSSPPPPPKKPTRSRPSGGFHKAFMVGTLPYMAPELLRHQPYTPAADIYSLGVTLNELATGCIPYSDVRSATVQMHTVLEANYTEASLTAAICADGLRPHLPNAVDMRLAVSSNNDALLMRFVNLVTACWSPDANVRPTASQLVSELEQIAAALGVGDSGAGTGNREQLLATQSPLLIDAEMVSCSALSLLSLKCFIGFSLSFFVTHMQL